MSHELRNFDLQPDHLHQHFADRRVAGKLLAERLAHDFANTSVAREAVVVGIAREGMILAEEVAQRMKLPLDILVVHTLRCSKDPQVKIGAVSSDGAYAVDCSRIEYMKADRQHLEQQISELRIKAADEEYEYWSQATSAPRIEWHDKPIIIVDEGVETGLTAEAALITARQRTNQTLIFLSPVISCDVFPRIRARCDQVVCLVMPRHLQRPFDLYADMSPFSERELVALISRNAFELEQIAI